MVNNLAQNPEVPPVPEKAPTPEKQEPIQVEKPQPIQPVQPQIQTPIPEGPVAAPTRPSHKSETLEKIEDIMEEDMAEVYQSLPADKKEEFRKKGEETAEEIEGMLFHVKVKSKKIFKLLFAWLKVIPGVNKYFLEQEAKIKTDEILHVKEDINRATGKEISD